MELITEIKNKVLGNYEAFFYPTYFLELLCFVCSGYFLGLDDLISFYLLFLCGFGFSLIAGWMIVINSINKVKGGEKNGLEEKKET